MTLTLRQIAERVGGVLHGDPDIAIHGAATIRDAQPGEITLAEGEKALRQLAHCPAAAVIVSPAPAPPGLPYIEVENPHAVFALVVETFRPQRPVQRVGVSPAARISPTARIAADVNIHPGATIGDDVEIESGVTIHSGVVVMSGCRIGAGTTLFPNVVLYENTIIGPECILHAGSVIGAFGFGYSMHNGRHERSAQLGYVELGPRVEVGACSTIDRGTYGATTVGEGTKIDNQVMIAHNCRIGKHNLICSQVGIAGSTTTGDYVVLAGQVGIRDHVEIGAGAQLGAQAGVMNDVPAGGVYVGAPAVPERDFFQCMYGFAKLPEMRKEFKRLQREVEALRAALKEPVPQREVA